MTPPSRRWGRWPELSTGQQLALVVLFAVIAWVAIALLRGGEVTSSNPEADITLAATAGIEEVTPETMQATSMLLLERMQGIGPAVLLSEVRGSRLVLHGARGIDPGILEELIAPGRIRIYAADQIERGDSAATPPAVTDPRDALLDDRENPGWKVAARGAPLASDDDLTVTLPEAGYEARTIAVIRPTGPARTALQRRIERTPLAIALDDTLISSNYRLDPEPEDRQRLEIRVDGELLLPSTFQALRARLVHGPLPLTLTPVS